MPVSSMFLFERGYSGACALFLICQLVLPYQTRFFPLALTSVFLAISFVALIFMEACRLWHNRSWGTDINSFEGGLGVGLLTVFCFSAFVANNSQTQFVRAYFMSAVTYVVVRSFFAKRVNMSVITNVLLAYLLINGALVLLQLLFGHSFFVATYFVNGGVGDYRYPIGIQDIPTMAGLYAALAAVWLICRISFGALRLSFFPVLAVFLGAASVLLCASRASIVTLMVGFLALLGASLIHAVRKEALALLLGVVLSGFLFAYWASGFTEAREGLDYKILVAASLPDGSRPVRVDGSVQQRMLAAKMVADVVEEQVERGSFLIPMFGVGIGNAESYYKEYVSGHGKPPWADDVGRNTISIHNSFLEFLFEAGGLAFLLLVVFSALPLVKAIRSRDESLLTLAVLFLSLSSWMLWHDYLRNRPYWILLAMMASAVAAQSKKRERESLEVLSQGMSR